MSLTPVGTRYPILTPLGHAPPPAVAAGGWWDNNGAIGCCIGAWQAKAAASYAASLLDLSGNGNNLTEGNGAVPWSAANGWEFNAANSQYFDTGIQPTSDQIWSGLVQFASASTTNAVLFGCQALVGVKWNRFIIQPLHTDIRVAYTNGTVMRLVPPQLVTGNLGIAGNQGYRNGVADGATFGGYTGAMNQNSFVGCMNDRGNPVNYITANIYAHAEYDCVLSAAEMLTIATLMAAL